MKIRYHRGVAAFELDASQTMRLTRTLALIAALVSPALALAARPVDPAGEPPKHRPDEKCMLACAETLRACIAPCQKKAKAKGDAKGQDELKTCAQDCAMKSRPCMEKCHPRRK